MFKISIQLASSLSNRIYFDATVTFLDFVDAQQQNARYLDKLTVQFQDLDPILKHWKWVINCESHRKCSRVAGVYVISYLYQVKIYLMSTVKLSTKLFHLIQRATVILGPLNLQIF